MKRKNKNIKIIFICLIIFTISVVLLLNFKKIILYSNLPVYLKINQFFKQNIQPDFIRINNKNYVWWISEDGYNIIDNKAFGVEAQFDCTDHKYDQFESSLNKISKLFPDFITQQGFTKNIINSSDSLDDPKFYDYIQAYEKGKLKCTLTANFDCSGASVENLVQTINFSCTSDFDENYANQIPILRDLKIKDAIIEISEQIDNFVILQVHYRRTGHYIIATNENGIWKELYSGQDVPSCNIMNKYGVPKQLYKNCY